jgi:hypothetical protein
LLHIGEASDRVKEVISGVIDLGVELQPDGLAALR